MPSLIQNPFSAVILFCVFATFCCSAAEADIRIVARESFNGRPVSTTTQWFGDGKRARIDGDSVVITRLDLGKVYMIDLARKSFESRELKLNPATAAISAVPTESTAIIGRWLCRKYLIEGSAARGMRISLWVTKDITLDNAGFSRQMVELGHQVGAEWLQVYAQIDGFPVKQEITATRGGVTQTRISEVISADSMEVPPETYLPPRGFQKSS